MAASARKKRTTAGKKPVRFSKALFDRILVDVMLGRTIREICHGPNRPTMEGFFGWLRKDEALAEQYTRARSVSADYFEAGREAEYYRKTISLQHRMKANVIRKIKSAYAPIYNRRPPHHPCWS